MISKLKLYCSTRTNARYTGVHLVYVCNLYFENDHGLLNKTHRGKAYVS